MVAISVSITESSKQIVSGIPQNVTLAANIPSSIFYTLDGTTPTVFSNIYISPLSMPTDKVIVTLKVLATNGIDFSPIISQTYLTNILNDARLSHSATDVQAQENIPSLYPFGTPPIQPMGTYLNPGDAGTTVDNQELSRTNTAFDGQGNPAAYTNKPYNIENYPIVYSTTDNLGQTLPHVGNLPGTVKVIPESEPPNTTQQYSNVFDPRAFVIFQDVSLEDPTTPPNINRQFFTLENPERSRDGNSYFNTALDAPPVSGSFLRSHYNPRDNTITYYYLDTWTNKWIISKTPYQPGGGTWDGNLSGMVLSNKPGAGFVFQWLPYTRRVLF
jgi:hypothetical protein